MTNQQRLDALIAAERAKRSDYLIAYALTKKITGGTHKTPEISEVQIH